MFEKISFKDYQNRKGLNQSSIKRILDNPQKWALGYDEIKMSSSMDFGSLCHDMILSPEEIENKYMFSSFDKLDLRKKEHKIAKDIADFDGKILISQQDKENAERVINSNLYFLQEFINKDKGDCELSYFGDFNGVECKARFDYISSDRKHIVDLKFVQDSSKIGFSNSVAKFGYYIQASFYLDLIGAETFTFLAIEKTEPYMIGLYQIDNVSLDLGRDKIKKALEIYKNRDFYKENFYFDKNKDNIIEIITLPNYEFYKD